MFTPNIEYENALRTLKKKNNEGKYGEEKGGRRGRGREIEIERERGRGSLIGGMGNEDEFNIIKLWFGLWREMKKREEKLEELFVF